MANSNQEIIRVPTKVIATPPLKWKIGTANINIKFKNTI